MAGPNKTVLIVDDVESNRLLIGKMVRDMGYKTILARDGHRGQLVLEDNPDVGCIITDSQMPVLDGPSMIRGIRSNRRYRELPILIYSSYMPLDDIANVLRDGPTSFLGYPVKAAQLREYLVRYLRSDLAEAGGRK